MMRHLLKRPFSLPKADGRTASARVEVRPRPDLLGWLAEELGVVDRHSVWQWVLSLFIYPPDRATRTKTPSRNTFFVLLVQIIGLLFSISVRIVLAGVRALRWFWQRLLSFLPSVNYE
ncbi:MAG: hypothetical protein ABL875_04950, partial [Candidatus Nitrotoga sp.]